MNRKNKKVWLLGLVLIVAGLLATGQLLRANGDGAEAPVKESAEETTKEEVEKGVKEETKEPASPKSQEQVLQDLLEEKSPGPMIITDNISDEVRVPSVEPVDPKTKPPLTVREGDVVINRMGRLVKDAKGTLLFVYESDAANLSEPPLILLPCMKLEQMELEVSKKPNAKFTVTGEVTVYRGKGYLLLRKAMLHRDLGQF